ncbi:MAG: MBL fold metallo-hydrolase [Candidatus Limnocylindrales bacterium]|nr:MBL fold metallo-hydrolase [Candidatus Limnocylindrales bacterium]
MTDPEGRLRLTVLGNSTAVPHPASAAAGYLVEWGETALLLDAGQGVIRSLQDLLDPHELTAVVVGHMHADHSLDLVGLRYLYPWGEPAADPLPVHLPPGGRVRLDALATGISERVGFFDDAYAIDEYDPSEPLVIGPLTIRFNSGRHYVPAWGLSVEAPDGARLVYTGDTGPSDSVVDFASEADLLLIEAALRLPAHDDAERGHLTAEEAIDMATRARARSALLVHYSPTRQTELEELCAAAGPWIRPAVPGLTAIVSPGHPAAIAAPADQEIVRTG